MASKNEFREAPKGDHITIPPAQGIYEVSATQMAPLGTRLAFSDGRVYRYALAGAVALAPGKFVYQPAISSNMVNKSVTAAAIGAYTTTVVTAAAAGNEAVGGYLMINDGTGEGISYKIKSVKANATTATSTDVTLYDPIATAIVASATSEATIVPNPYYGLLIATATTDFIVGVPPVTVTASYYFWVQTWGIAAVWSEGTPAAGTLIQCAAGNTVAGTTTHAGDAVPVLGIQVQLGVATEYKEVYLTIAP